MELYNDDCLKIMPQITDKSIDMILCDLPYGVTHNKWDSVIPFDKLWEQYNRIIKDNGAICLFADGMFMADLMESNRKMWRYNLVWDKVLSSGFLNAKRMPLRSTEEIVVFYRKLPTYNPQFTEGEPLHGMGTKYKEGNRKNNNYGNFDSTNQASAMRVGDTNRNESRRYEEVSEIAGDIPKSTQLRYAPSNRETGGFNGVAYQHLHK